MKRSRLVGLLCCAATVFFLSSCGGSDTTEEKSTTDSATGSTNTNTATPEVNTIITTPQTMLTVVHKVSDYEKWKPSYDAHDSMRLANGIHSYVIGRGVDDPNMVLVAVKADDVEKAKAFMKNPSLKQAMQKGGVTGSPSMSLVNTVYQDTSPLDPNVLRSRTTFTVKDWDVWRKNFEDGKQERIDNGIAVRAYGHDIDDNKKVSLVTALLDTAKAYAYWKSDMLKKRREAGGVIGEPKRFVFRVAQRY